MSEGEADSEAEDQDVEAELGTWLGQLETLKMGLDSEEGDISDVVCRREKTVLTPKMVMESFRMSVIGPGGGDMDLDAILGELCQLETQLNASNLDNNLLNADVTNDLPLAPSVGSTINPYPHASTMPPRGISEDFEDMEESLKNVFSSLNEMGQKHGTQKDNTYELYETNTVKRRHDKSSRDSGHHADHAQTVTDRTNHTGSNHHQHMDLPISSSTSHHHSGGFPGNMDKSPSRLEKVENWNISTSFSGNALGVDVSETDSVHSDSVSLPSSDSGVSMAASASQLCAMSTGTRCSVNMSADQDRSDGAPLSPVHADVRARLDHVQRMMVNACVASEEQASRLKYEKIKIAMEKIRQSNFNKLFVRVHTLDMCSKSIMVDERMTAAQVVAMLVAKNHCKPNLDWAVVEHMPELYMERFLEDHDSVVDAILLWSQKTKNKLLFVERPIKYDLFKKPEMYLIPESCSSSSASYDQSSRKALVQEFFSDTGSRVPEMEGLLWLKMDGRKVWKKFFFMVRASGLYYNPKGKSKCSKDLVCLQQFRLAEIYTALQWRKKFKAPTEYGFALKHPQIQKKCKYIKYLCAEDEASFYQWVMAMRIAKSGKQLLHNYDMSSYTIDTWDTNNVLTYGEQLLQIMATSSGKDSSSTSTLTRRHQRNKSDGSIKMKKRSTSTVDNPRESIHKENGNEAKARSLENMLDCIDGEDGSRTPTGSDTNSSHTARAQRRMSSDSILSSCSRSTDVSDGSSSRYHSLTPTSTLTRSRRKASIPITTGVTRHLTSGVPETNTPNPELTRAISLRRSLKLRKEDVAKLTVSLAKSSPDGEGNVDLPPPPSPHTLHKLDLNSHGSSPGSSSASSRQSSISIGSSSSSSVTGGVQSKNTTPRHSSISADYATPERSEVKQAVPPAELGDSDDSAYLPPPPPAMMELDMAYLPPTSQVSRQPSHPQVVQPLPPPTISATPHTVRAPPPPVAGKPSSAVEVVPRSTDTVDTPSPAMVNVCSPGAIRRPKPAVPRKDSKSSLLGDMSAPRKDIQGAPPSVVSPKQSLPVQRTSIQSPVAMPTLPHQSSEPVYDEVHTSSRQSVAKLSAQLSMEFSKKSPIMTSPMGQQPLSPQGCPPQFPQHLASRSSVLPPLPTSAPPIQRMSPMSPGMTPRSSQRSSAPVHGGMPHHSRSLSHSHPMGSPPSHSHHHQHQRTLSYNNPGSVGVLPPHPGMTGVAPQQIRRASTQSSERGGGGKKLPPPPPRRSVTTRLSIRNQSSRFAVLPDTAEVGPSIQFLDDLTNVIYYKEDQYYGLVPPPPYVHGYQPDHHQSDYLPPPPPELLEGLTSYPVGRTNVATPPLPPPPP